jgi:hypothetical protein
MESWQSQWEQVLCKGQDTGAPARDDGESAHAWLIGEHRRVTVADEYGEGGLLQPVGQRVTIQPKLVRQLAPGRGRR